MKLKKRYLKHLWAILFLIVIILVFFHNPFRAVEKKGGLPSEACFENGVCIGLEIAVTEEEKMNGLMNREELAEDAGMLFVYEDLQLKKFWMKDTFIALDIIWLDENDKIIYIEKNAQPCKEESCPAYGMDVFSKNVLEVNGGFAVKNNINVGDIVIFK